MTLPEKREHLLATLGAIKIPQERFAHVVQAGRERSLDAEFKTDAFRVEGCLAKLWFVPEFRDGKCLFRADSDSAIVKGIAVMLCDFYSGHAPAEILAVNPAFLETVGITQHLTQNRRNSLSKIWERIQAFASAHIENAKT
jgi:cysteine desulfuration protein SufE